MDTIIFHSREKKVTRAAKPVCDSCSKEMQGSEIPTGSCICRDCCAGKSALDGRTREEIVTDPLLYKIQWAVNGALEQCVGTQRSNVEYHNWRREGRRLASMKYRDSEHGKAQIAQRRLFEEEALFTLEQWRTRIGVVFESKCYNCGEGLNDFPFRVVLKKDRDGSPSRHLGDSFPACESCKNKIAAAARWKN
jgi:hypothetical protein